MIVVVDLQRPVRNPTADGAFEEGVLVRAQGSDGTELVSELSIKGRMRPSHTISPSSLEFGRVIWGEGVRRECQIKCVAPCSVGPLKVLSAPDGIEAAVSRSIREPNTWLLAARAKATSYGQIRGRIRLGAQLPSSVVVTRSVAVRGQVEDDLHSLPSSLFFGVPPLSLARQCVTLASRRREAFKAESIVFDEKLLSVERSSAGDGTGTKGVHSYTVRLVGPPVAELPLGLAVVFHLRAASGRRYGLKVPVTAAM